MKDLISMIHEKENFDDILKENQMHKNDLLIELSYLINTSDPDIKIYIKNLLKQNFFYKSFFDKQKFIIISDTHFGNMRDNFAYIDTIYNLAYNKSINDIFILGDLFESSKRKMNISGKTAFDLLHYFSKNYPYDKNITNYLLLGNHDYNLFENDEYDLNIHIPLHRKDFVTMGYKNAQIMVNNDIINFHHVIKKNVPNYFRTDFLIKFSGHFHHYLYTLHSDTNKHYFDVPSISNITMDSHTKLDKPGFFICEVYNNYLIVKHYSMYSYSVGKTNEEVIPLTRVR